ncbi:MAG: DUF2461 domain-containing protein [Dysgonamonadaceae bacterium]|jgi:uncharacterized protein (TIGR02453 family)|nr:DUF2461 domain-containing protein [Dysgonamonadaceae bacterium]
MKTTEHFTGFSSETFRFFADLEENNYKPWFEEHRAVYEREVLQPLKALAVALTPSFYGIDPQLDLRPNRMISRIYRDIRFSYDKTPYKQHMWISFQRPFKKQTPEWETFPGFYLETGKDGAGYGMGMFAAKKKIMDRFRDRVAYEPAHFREITAELLSTHHFRLGGEAYKRPVKNDLPDDFQPWIQRKGLYLFKNLPVSEVLFSEAFVPYMEKEFSLLQPLYEFFIDVCD